MIEDKDEIQVEYYIMENDAYCDAPLSKFIKSLIAHGITGEELDNKIAEKTEYRIQDIKNVGFTEKEAIEKVSALIEESKKKVGI